MTAAPILDHVDRRPNAGVLVNLSEAASTDVITALAESKLDWGVETSPIYASPNDGTDPVLVTDRRAVMKVEATGPSYLATVGATYPVISNLDAALPLQRLIDDGRIRLAQGGSTKNGRHGFLLAELVEGTSLTTDPHSRFLLAKWNHSGDAALSLHAVSRRYFCTNQVPALVAQSGGIVSIRHDRHSEARMNALPGVLDLLVGSFADWDAQWEVLCQQQATPLDVDLFVERLFPKPVGPDVTERMRINVADRRDLVTKLALDSSTNENIRGTKASLFAAASEWSDWYHGKDAARRTARALEGRNTAFLRRAWHLVGAP